MLLKNTNRRKPDFVSFFLKYVAVCTYYVLIISTGIIRIEKQKLYKYVVIIPSYQKITYKKCKK